jgi:hypothetical protein
VRRETVKLRNAKQVPFSPQSKQPESDFDLTLKDAVDESFKTPLKQKITKFQEKTVLENEEIRIKMMMFQPAFVPILLASLRNSTSKREMKNSTAVTSLFEMALQKVIQTYQSREVQNIK